MTTFLKFITSIIGLMLLGGVLVASAQTAPTTMTPTVGVVGSTHTPTRVPSVVPIHVNPTPTQGFVGVPTQVPTLPPGVFPTNTPRFTATPALIPGDHLWFWRPFPRDTSGQINDMPARSYAYGSTGGGGLQIHHGVDTQNPVGTQVQAIGHGEVVYAGDDLTIIFGRHLDFYGNLVIIEHDYLAPNNERIYSLYGHLSRVMVATGQRVVAGEVVGAVGAEGVALGAHLHLEIRLGDPFDYNATVNPQLWTLPWPNHGVLGARITGPEGELLQGVRVELIGRGEFITGYSYESESVNGDPWLQENLVIADLRAGEYELKVGEVRNILHRETVTIEEGIVTMLHIQLDNFARSE